MKVEQNRVVQFNYEMSVVDGDFSESSGDSPVACLVGHRNVLPALEKLLLGLEAGEQVAVTLLPDDAYGQRRDSAIQRVPIKHLLTKGKLKPGMVVKVNAQEGPKDATVVKVGKFNVDLDTNHPLAGKELSFVITIVDVREASDEEIAHGHAHGTGGHHH